MTMSLEGQRQADQSSNNELVLLKVANISRTKRKRPTDSDDDDDDDSSESEADDDEEKSVLLLHWSMKYTSSVNRLRVGLVLLCCKPCYRRKI